MGSHNMAWEFNPQYPDHRKDPELMYLSKLSHAKSAINNYFLHGRVQRDLPDQPQIPPKSLVGMAWLSQDKQSLLVPLTTPKS